MEQIQRDKFPSNGGWRFKQPQFGPAWENKMAMVGFEASVRNIIAERKKNKAVSEKHGLSTDYNTVAEELITFNCLVRKVHRPLNRATKSHAPMLLKTIPLQSARIVGKICITTTFDRNYSMAGKAMFNSIRHHTDCRGIDFKIITADPEVVKEFGAENCHFVDETVKARYGNVAYIALLPPDRYSHSWYRYEMFNFKGYDRVICIDSDCLCLNDISFLFSEDLNAYDIISVEDHIVSKVFVNCIPQLNAQGANLSSLQKRMDDGKVDIQPALIVANKRVVNGTWYERLLYYANHTGFTYSIDEGILNDFIYMDNLNIRLLPLEFDYQDIYETECPGLPVPTNPIIVHCEGSKPFKKDKKSIDARLHKWHDHWWHEYYAQ